MKTTSENIYFFLVCLMYSTPYTHPDEERFAQPCQVRVGFVCGLKISSRPKLCHQAKDMMTVQGDLTSASEMHGKLWQDLSFDTIHFTLMMLFIVGLAFSPRTSWNLCLQGSNLDNFLRVSLKPLVGTSGMREMTSMCPRRTT